MAKATDFCGIYTGKRWINSPNAALKRDISKFPAPYIKDCPLSLPPYGKAGRHRKNPTPLGTHDMFWARIISVRAKSELIDENGRLMLDKAKLMSYTHGEYFAAGQLGRFGFDRQKKQ